MENAMLPKSDEIEDQGFEDIVSHNLWDEDEKRMEEDTKMIEKIMTTKLLKKVNGTFSLGKI